jgi:hypothetical protein
MQKYEPRQPKLHLRQYLSYWTGKWIERKNIYMSVCPKESVPMPYDPKTLHKSDSDMGHRSNLFDR